jgi:hypothetical protein
VQLRRFMMTATLALFALSLQTAFAGQDQRPTLNKPGSSGKASPEEPPSLKGPVSATIIDAHQLLRVRRVYVESMDNDLNLKIDQALAKLGPFTIADSRDAADAILRGTCFDSPRLKDVHSEVFLTTKAGKAIWQDVIRRPYNPPALSKAVDQTANLVALHLRASLEEARRR